MSLAGTAPLQSGASTQPALAEPFEPASTQKGDKVRERGVGLDTTALETDEPAKKNKMRGLFGIGKKKADESAQAASRSDPASTSTTATSSNRLTKQPRSTTSPARTHSPVPGMPSSPSHGLSSPSPRLSSPAGSQIFERDVQEAALIPNSPAIPSHIITEDHVPPVLNASSEAITDDHLDPDTVEIITHANHQPAGVAVNVAGIPDNTSTSWQDDLAASLSAADFRALADPMDTGSNSGSPENSVDVRRLSFISFADVVQAEHQGHAGLAGSRDSIHLAGLTSIPSMGGIDHRSPSPIRSPVSSTTGGAGTSPPNSKSASLRGTETSPTRKPLGSPVSTSLSMSPSIPPMGIPGEVNVETMTQALRRTGSGDLSGVKSHPTSPIDGTSSR